MSDLITRAVDDVDHRSRGYQVIVVGTVLTALATLGMIARLISARMTKRSFDTGDALLVFSFSLNVFQFGLLAWGTGHAGWGRHYASLNDHERVYFAKIYTSSGFIQPALLMSAKMSVLLLLYKVFTPRPSRITVISFMAIVVAWWISITLAYAFICTPFDSNWGVHPANCGNAHVLALIAPIPWIVTDFGILILPMPMIRQLHLLKRQKVALAGLFLIGGLTCIVSCVRYRYVFFSFNDLTWEITGLAICQLAESNSTILCACLIASRPCVMRLMPSRLFRDGWQSDALTTTTTTTTNNSTSSHA